MKQLGMLQSFDSEFESRNLRFKFYLRFRYNQNGGLSEFSANFYRLHQGPFPLLSEQLFSGVGLIYNPLRNRSDGDKAAKLLVVTYNL